MAETTIEGGDRDSYWVVGALDFTTVGPLVGRGEALAAAARKGGVLHVDLSAVSRTDSAGIALLLDWLRAARRQGVALNFTAMPPQMERIARACGVAALLGLGG